MDWVDTAPTPGRTKGQLAPTAKAQVATATAEAPVSGSWAVMDQVMRAKPSTLRGAAPGGSLHRNARTEDAAMPTPARRPRRRGPGLEG